MNIYVRVAQTMSATTFVLQRMFFMRFTIRQITRVL